VHMGDLTAARQSYRRAAQLFQGRWRDISAMRRQVRELLRQRDEDPAGADDSFGLPAIVVFAGHMLDKPGRTSPRFPLEREAAVKSQIAQFLERGNVGFGYSSAACGGDILFCECLLERAAEVHVVLPCPVEAFKRLSVSFAGPEWESRFDQVLARAKTCAIANPAEVTASEESQLSQVGQVYTNRIITGLALLQARALDLELRTLALWDGRSGDGPGGTSSVVADWIAQQRPPYVISPMGADSPGTVGGPAVPRRSQEYWGLAISEMQQDIKAVIFADVAGYSRLTEAQIRPFVTEFMGAVSRLIVGSTAPPVIMQTWGDGLHFAFDRVRAAARFALELRDLVATIDWSKNGLPSDLSIRIALHAGPVFACIQPVTRQLAFTGAHITRAARIEPVTARGQIYTSQEFAALCAAEGATEFAFEYLGQLPTAKNFGHAPLYRLSRRH
jgi:class 3 adenylate cyclase